MITSAWDVGTMFASLIVAYFGNTGHKTRWVACGIIMGSISCFLRYTPHLLYGPGEEAVLISTPNASSPGNLFASVSNVALDTSHVRSFGGHSLIQYIAGHQTVFSRYYTIDHRTVNWKKSPLRVAPCY